MEGNKKKWSRPESGNRNQLKKMEGTLEMKNLGTRPETPKKASPTEYKRWKRKS